MVSMGHVESVVGVGVRAAVRVARAGCVPASLALALALLLVLGSVVRLS